MLQRQLAVLGLSISILFVLTQYQNCAQSPQVNLTHAASSSADSEVRIVDDWNQQKVALMESRVEFRASAMSATIDGLCKRTDQNVLSWRLNNQSDQVLAEGSSPCEMGGFRVALTDLQDLSCGEDFLLEVEHPDGEVDSLWINKLCQSAVAVSLKTLDGEGECYFERKSSDEGDSCNQVCYRQQYVMVNKQVATNLCPQLQAQAQ